MIYMFQAFPQDFGQAQRQDMAELGLIQKGAH